MPPTRTLVFDLTELGRRTYAWRSGIRKIVLAGFYVFIVVAAILLLVTISRGTFLANLRYTFGLGYVGFAVGIFITAWGAWLLGPGANELRLVPGGFALRYPSGRVDVGRWDDPRVRLTLWDFSAGAAYLPVDAWYEATIPNRPHTQLTRAAFDAVLASAREVGIEPEVRRVNPLIRGAEGAKLTLRFHKDPQDRPRATVVRD
jgi:hypothetical protein